jgi:hypothetical protein
LRCGYSLAPYDTLAEAAEAAFEAARAAGKCGFSANVLVLQAQGGWASVEGRRRF